MELKPFIELLKRASKSKFPTMLFHNRMLMNCYSIAEDADIGMHYILHVPYREEYSDPFYDETFLINPNDFLAVYKEGHDILNARKKETKAKPKEVREELSFKITDKHLVIKMIYIVQDEIVDTKSYKISYPIDMANPIVDNVVDTYSKMFDRLKVGGYGVAIDGQKHMLYERAQETPDIVRFKVKIGETKVSVPVYKSLFNSSNFDEFFISVQETNLPYIYLYTVQLARSGLIEQWIGYCVNYIDKK